MYVLTFSAVLLTIFLILTRVQRYIVINVKTLHAKYPLFLTDFNETWSFSTDFRKEKTQVSRFITIRPVGAELFHADG